MPFYEYQCSACAHKLEVLQKISDEPLCYCPECGEARLKKLISRAGFRLKGGGWYETDFKHSGAPKDSPAQKDPSGKADAGKDSKGATPTGDAATGKQKQNGGTVKKSPSSAEPIQTNA